jgi:hypothetical protein
VRRRIYVRVPTWFLFVLSWGTELTFFYLVHMIDIMQRMSEGEHGSEVAKTRVSVLSNYVI